MVPIEDLTDVTLAIEEVMKVNKLDLFDGHFFGAMEWLMFFSRAPSALMVFQWFCQR